MLCVNQGELWTLVLSSDKNIPDRSHFTSKACRLLLTAHRLVRPACSVAGDESSALMCFFVEDLAMVDHRPNI